MSIPLITIHVVISVIIILVVLLQMGKGAETGAMFGGTGQAYTMRGSNTFISKFTTGLAMAFMLTSLLLTYYTSNRTKSSVIDKVSQEKTERAAPADASTDNPEAILPGKVIPIDDFEKKQASPSASESTKAKSAKVNKVKTKPSAAESTPAKPLKDKKTSSASPKADKKASSPPVVDKKAK